MDNELRWEFCGKWATSRGIYGPSYDNSIFYFTLPELVKIIKKLNLPFIITENFHTSTLPFNVKHLEAGGTVWHMNETELFKFCENL